MSICSHYLETTIRPAPVTVTKYITKARDNKAARHAASSTASSLTRAEIETLPSRAVPALAGAHCPRHGQYSSACRCWARITAQITTLATPTVTVRATRYLDVACPPTAAAVTRAVRFPCAAGWGLCSCLKAGRDDVCVRVGTRMGDHGGWGANVTGPCAAHSECGADGECEAGYICVYDGSCPCGKKRCYSAVPKGCEIQGLPWVDQRRKRALEHRASEYGL
ncbi:hypothetical protein G7Z17_g9055 [Cylindrodendrum hubeiense]|uniref:Uncharacterized protein n=1 Tax=Cylindrodendrum hubeiense TaxID=595255 RepID=A0A9P5LDQ7_9HYPO|nr:hypothetical protein G7Z17_g9055 [Cylindrodendrum hubeiense]